MSTVETLKKLFDGVSPDDMTHLPDVSQYNSNYYSFNGRLLYGKSDDDNFTEWYWFRGHQSITVGGSYTSDGDKIIVGLDIT